MCFYTDHLLSLFHINKFELSDISHQIIRIAALEHANLPGLTL